MTEQQKVEWLLRPRYEVIADWPKSIYKVGEILVTDKRNGDLLYCDTAGPRMSQYPHLFKPLPWWHGRKLLEMPEYLKDENGEVWKVWEYANIESGYVLLKKNFRDPEHPYGDHSLYELFPATKAEYEQYIQSQK